MIQEALLILLIVLILWPKPVLGAAKWVMRHAFGSGSSGDPEPEQDDGEGDGARRE